MKKLLLTTLLTLISTSAMAGWVLIDGNNNGDLYADVKSIRKVGNKVKMWTLVDFKVPQDVRGHESYLSFVVYDEYDCVDATTKTLSANFYSENMQKGSVVHSSNYAVGERTNDPVAPNTLAETAWLKACGKK